MKKRVLSILLIFVLCFVAVGCNDDENTQSEPVNEITTYAIEYQLNGGINADENPTDIEEVDGEVELKSPSRYAYNFKGWFLTEDFTGDSISKLSLSNLSGDVTLYAKWEFDESYVDNLPLISINTQDCVLPVDKTNYVNCSFDLSNCENESDNFSVEMKSKYGDDDSVGIRLRGNSTLGAVKKPYRIKFDKKKSLFGLEKNKSWVLLADYNDQSSVRNYTAFKLGEYFDNLDFTPTPNHVVLMLNGEWKGLYLLCEQVDEKEGRANVEEDFDVSTDEDYPFLIEMDRNALSEGTTGIDNFQISGLHPIEIKYPEFDERGISKGEDDKVFNYIVDYMTAVYQTLVSDEPVYFKDEVVTFEDLVDVDSFIDYHLLNEFMYNPDNVWGSIYFHKTKNGKLECGPVWDFDWSCSNQYLVPYQFSYIECARKLRISKDSILFNAFIKNEINYNKVVARWKSIAGNVKNIVNDLRGYKNVIRNIAHKDSILWYGQTGAFQFDMQYDYVRLFAFDRVDYFNEIFELTHVEFLNLIK